jgi:Holliday junction resolvasome RuvABC endonuclease subunit
MSLRGTKQAAMNLPALETWRVLAIDPTSRGFGFAVLEGPAALIDWGVKHASGDRNARCLEQAAELIGRYQPEVLVVERTGVKDCRRCPRVRQLIENLLALASDRRLRARRVSRRRVQRCFSPRGSVTKRQIAVALAERFPELEPHLPPVRKPWMSEDERMSIFDAVAFGWASYESLRWESRALALLSLETPLPHA